MTTHCIEWTGTGLMAMGNVYAEPVVTDRGDEFLMEVAFADPVSDIAVLCEPDNQLLFDDFDRFEAWSEATEPVLLSDQMPARGESVPVHMFTKDRTWVTGRADRAPGLFPHTGQLPMKFPSERGDSGGPILDDAGRLFGVVSQGSYVLTGEPGEPRIEYARTPVPHLTLPKWILDRIAG